MERQMRRLSTTTIGMMAWSKRVCVLLVVVSLLFDLSVCLCRPECLSVTGLRFTKYGRVSRGQVTAKLNVFTPTFTIRGQTHTGTVHLPKTSAKFGHTTQSKTTGRERRRPGARLPIDSTIRTPRKSKTRGPRVSVTISLLQETTILESE